MSVTIVGLDDAMNAIGDWRTDAPLKVATALYLECNDIFNESQAIVPVDTGTLKSSGYVDGPHVTGYEAEVTIGYGGAAQQYAIYVHEDMEATHAFPTRAKFLEEPVMQHLDGLGERLLARMAM